MPLEPCAHCKDTMDYRLGHFPRGTFTDPPAPNKEWVIVVGQQPGPASAFEKSRFALTNGDLSALMEVEAETTKLVMERHYYFLMIRWFLEAIGFKGAIHWTDAVLCPHVDFQKAVGVCAPTHLKNGFPDEGEIKGIVWLGKVWRGHKKHKDFLSELVGDLPRVVLLHPSLQNAREWLDMIYLLHSMSEEKRRSLPFQIPLDHWSDNIDFGGKQVPCIDLKSLQAWHEKKQ